MKNLFSLINIIVILGTINAVAQTSDYKMSDRNSSFAEQLEKYFVEKSVQNMEDADQVLNLTVNQKDEIVYINFMYSKRTQILSETGASPEEIKQHRNNMIQMTLNDYSYVLTESQVVLLEKNKEMLMDKGLE